MCIKNCNKYNMGVILLFDQYLLVKQQNETYIILLQY